MATEEEELLLRQLPHSTEAEQAVLGSMLIDPRCVPEVIDKLRPDDFYLQQNRDIYETIYSMFNYSMTIDPVTVLENMKQNGVYDENQSRGYLLQLMDTTPTAANVKEYIDILKDNTLQRRVAETAGDLLAMVRQGSDTGQDILEAAEQRIYAIRQGRSARGLTPISDVIIDVYDRLAELAASDSAIPGLSTGLRDLDRAISGLNKSDLILLAARPGMGKTALAIAIAEYAAQSGRVMFLSMEMTGDQLTARRIAKAARVDSRTLLTDTLSPEEYKRVVEAGSKIESSGLEITDGRSYTTARITSIVRSKPDVRLVVIDHFSLIQVPGRQANHIEYANASKALKALAKSIQAPVLCLAQLNRQSEERRDKRPQLSDLRETGAAEQDADGVLLLHRPDYYDNGPEVQVGDLTAPSSMDVILAKNRHGPTGRTVLSYYKSTNTFREAYTK